jgi:hypothetical protein
LKSPRGKTTGCALRCCNGNKGKFAC